MRQILFCSIMLASCAIKSVEFDSKITDQNNKITVKNIIKPEMLSYFCYKPDFFCLAVNGKKVEPGSSIALSNNQNQLTIRYDYSFAKGFRTGAKEITFELNSDKKEYEVMFSWKNKDRIIMPGGIAKVIKRLEFNPN